MKTGHDGATSLSAAAKKKVMYDIYVHGDTDDLHVYVIPQL